MAENTVSRPYICGTARSKCGPRLSLLRGVGLAEITGIAFPPVRQGNDYRN